MRKRRRTHLTLDAALVAEARALGIKKERRWREENAEAIKSFNRYVEEHGLPLEHERLF